MSTSAPGGFFPGHVKSAKAAEDMSLKRYRFLRDNTVNGEVLIAVDPTTFPICGIGNIYSAAMLGTAVDIVDSGTAPLSIADSSLGVGALVMPNSVGQGTFCSFASGLAKAAIRTPVTVANSVVEVNLLF